MLFHRRPFTKVFHSIINDKSHLRNDSVSLVSVQPGSPRFGKIYSIYDFERNPNICIVANNATGPLAELSFISFYASGTLI